MRALVLSGGGLFGAWQAGAWAALSDWQPDLVVGASVGSLNGYLIACGTSPEALGDLWLHERVSDLKQLSANLRELTERCTLTTEFAVVVTDLLRLKPRVYRGREVTWRHLAASCAVPLAFAPVAIEGRLMLDGGLLNPLPVWAAVELGATEILALHALPEIPSVWLQPFVRVFRGIFGVHPPVPPQVRCTTILPRKKLGSLHDALHWERGNIERWLQQGYEDAICTAGAPEKSTRIPSSL